MLCAIGFIDEETKRRRPRCRQAIITRVITLPNVLKRSLNVIKGDIFRGLDGDEGGEVVVMVVGSRKWKVGSGK